MLFLHSRAATFSRRQTIDCVAKAEKTGDQRLAVCGLMILAYTCEIRGDVSRLVGRQDRWVAAAITKVVKDAGP